jgi:hypothetical protein
VTPPPRIFDEPNHPQYGPVRRMWVVLVQLDMLNAAERWSAHHNCPWDESLALQIEHHPHVKESAYQRAMIGNLLEGWI